VPRIGKILSSATSNETGRVMPLAAISRRAAASQLRSDPNRQCSRHVPIRLLIVGKLRHRLVPEERRRSPAPALFSVGRSPDKEVDVYVSGNNIRNVTESAINFRYIGGRAHAERNLLMRGAVTGGAANPT